MADSTSNLIFPSTTTSSSTSPSVNGTNQPHRIRIRLTQNGHDNDSATDQTGSMSSSTNQSPRSSPHKVEPPASDSMQNGRTDIFRNRFSESLSPAPARSSTISPSRGQSSIEVSNNKKSHDRTPSATSSSNNASPIKTVRRRRLEPIFVCSRDYAPLPAETQLDPHSEAWNSSKRTELSRFKAKTDAHGVMTSNGDVGGSDAALDNPPTPSLHPLRKLQTMETNLPRLPLNTSSAQDENVPMIPTHHCTPRISPPRLRPRLFDLEEAPTFYPTWEEFADPLAYIEHISDPKGGNGRAYGIVKIVPPEGWNPDFVLNQDQFRFRTRMQRLNSLSADARASLNYLEQLQKFHAQQGHARVSIPIVDRRAVDLYNLRLIVNTMGGYEVIAKSRNWANVTRKLGYEEKDAGHLAAQIKAAYTRIILPFEKFLIANKETAEAQRGRRASRSPEQRYNSNASMSPSSSVGAIQAQTTPAHQTSSAAAAATALFDAESNEVDRSLDDLESNKRRSTRKRYDPLKSSGLTLLGKDTASPDSGKKKFIVVPGAEEQMCEICLRGDNGTAMLLCDDCNRGYHMYCLDPPLTSIPKSQWYCPPCLVGTGNDYGFEDGDTHSLSSFWNRAESFRAAWWSQHANHIWTPDMDKTGKVNGLTRPVAGAGLHVSEDDVEREFWRLVHNPDENVEVEYGADVHSTTHGSALPTLETFPLSAYARDGWNLNNLPILADSLLRFIKSDISGMTVPWLYVGMIFSTFCWHIEDHYTYSINYQHFGDTKTWYGVPGADAHLLEEALRTAAPDLFEQSPDLLDQLVTMMSPDKLKKHGVHVYACDQRANEFVITYPRAYHSGFNHGFNVNEAVNFALPDWIDAGLESVKRYKQSHRSPVFSHDKLLMTVYQHNHSVDTAIWLQNSMDEMVKREIMQRNQLRRLVPTIVEIIDGGEVEDEKEKPELQYQCAYCKVFCYLGQITSEKSQGVACLDHGNEVCGIDSPTKWTLRLRHSDESLTSMLAKTIERAAVPSMWQTRLKRLIVSGPRPNLRNLRGLLTDGEKIPFEILEVKDLRVFVRRANIWVDEATTFITRKHQKRSGATKEPVAPVSRRGKRGSKIIEEEEEVEGELGEQDRIYTLLEEADLLSFDAPEIGALRAVVHAMEDFNHRADLISKQIQNGLEPKLIECEDILSIGLSLNVKLPLLEPLQKHVGKQKWIKEVKKIEESFTNIEDVESFLQEGNNLDISREDALMVLLRDRYDAGLQWKSKAEAVLGMNSKPSDATRFTIEEAEALLRASYKVAIDPDLHVKVEGLLKHVREWGRQCEALANVEKVKDPMEAYRKYLEASRLLKHMADSSIIIKDEEKLLKMKTKQDVFEMSLYNRLLDGSDKWEATMVLEVDARLKANFLNPMEECLAPRIDSSCICYSTKSEKGATIDCNKCSVSYHIKCLGLDKKQAREKDWECHFCDTKKLPNLVARQNNKKELGEVINILASAAGSQRWGKTPTYRHLDKIRNMASSVESFEAPAKDQPKQRIERIKQLIYCPLQLKTAETTKDPLLSLVESLYKESDLDINGFGVVIKEATIPSVSNYKVSTIPPFRSASRESGRSFVAASNSATATTLPMLAPAPQQDNGPPPFNSHGNESQADVTMNTTMMDYSDGEEASATANQFTSSKRGRSSMTSDERKRKRGKRAKFVFEEEVGIFVPVQGERIYCLCHQPETGTMVSCERCSLWFHNTCVHITSETDLGEEKWICPMCCVKTERKYPHAEVKVKAMGEIDPNLWIDVRATLRSTRGPVTKMQHWGAEPHKRIALHLESFYPATLPSAKDVNKRQKNNEGSPGPRHARGESNSSQGDALPHHPNALGSISRNPTWSDVKARVTPAHRTPLAEERVRLAEEEAQERHKAGMANLYSRGVTDAMVQRWYVGWNGLDLVYPRKDRYGVFHELNLGPHIELGPDDPDGSILISEKLAEEADRLRRESAYSTSTSDIGEVDRLGLQAVPSPPMSSTNIPIRSTISTHQAPPGSWRRPLHALETRPLPTFARPSLTISPIPSHRSTAVAAAAATTNESRPSPPSQFTAKTLPPIPPHRSGTMSIASLVPPPLPPFAARSAISSNGDNVKSPSLTHRYELPRAPTITSSSNNNSAATSSSANSPRAIIRPLAPLQRGPSALSLQGGNNSTSSSPTLSSTNIHSPTSRIRNDTPENKSLEEYRMLARKMKPNATKEEIEMMARHAMY